MCCKAKETTCNISQFNSGTANEGTVWWWFKKISKGDDRIEDEASSGQSSEADDDQLRAITEAAPLTTIQEAAEDLKADKSTIIQHLKQIGKMSWWECKLVQPLWRTVWRFLKNTGNRTAI